MNKLSYYFGVLPQGKAPNYVVGEPRVSTGVKLVFIYTCWFWVVWTLVEMGDKYIVNEFWDKLVMVSVFVLSFCYHLIEQIKIRRHKHFWYYLGTSRGFKACAQQGWPNGIMEPIIQAIAPDYYHKNAFMWGIYLIWGYLSIYGLFLVCQLLFQDGSSVLWEKFRLPLMLLSAFAILGLTILVRRMIAKAIARAQLEFAATMTAPLEEQIERLNNSRQTAEDEVERLQEALKRIKDQAAELLPHAVMLLKLDKRSGDKAIGEARHTLQVMLRLIVSDEVECFALLHKAREAIENAETTDT